MTPRRALVFSVASAAAALGGATALAHALQVRAAARSHELPPWTPWPAPAGLTPAELRDTGRKLFLNSCAHCHGKDARGDEGPDLHALDVSDRRIATVVRRGIKGEMPSFAKKLSPADTAALIAYLRTLE